ncbi:MAG: glycine/sarcosine/betaine reductase selenoprotein B family protein [Thermodesulfovibrionales bacterium]
MAGLKRLKNKLIAKLLTRFPSLTKRFTESYAPWEAEDVPWTPVTKLLRDCAVAIVTTAGVHQRDQEPFDMKDRNGDPSYREIDGRLPLEELMITHDYYDHADADKDINIVFPLERLREFEREGFIGRVARRHFGFMGHIDGPHIRTLMERTGPEAAAKLRDDGVDVVLLTPG